MNKIRTAIVGALVAAMAFGATAAFAQETLSLYGPGGPYPAMREAAAAFGQARGVRLEVTAGPTGKWLDKAKGDADLIFSGAENMMTDFVKAMDGRIDEASITPLYLRPSAILVRPGNPKGIKGVADLFKPGLKVLVVQGAGQNGLWEDVAGRKGDIRSVKALRGNIVAFAANSAEARSLWTERTDIDAWLIWNIWQVANKDLASLVPTEKDYTIYRDCGVALTKQGKEKPLAREFVAFLQSKEGAAIFAKWGWLTDAPR